MSPDAFALATNPFVETFEQCAVGLAHVRPTGRFLRVNECFCQFIGYSQQELENMTFQDLTHSSHLSEDILNVTRLITGECESYTMEKQYIHKSGTLIWAKLTVSLVRDKEGKPDFFISVIEDIDARKRKVMQLYETEKLFRQIVSSLSDHTVIWVASPNLERMHYVNEGYRHIWGRPQSELLTKPKSFTFYVHPEDRLRVSRHYADETLRDWDIEYRIVRGDGEVRFIRDRGNTLDDDHGNALYLVGMAEDISRDKQLYQALLEANRRLETLSRIDGLTELYNRREIINQIDSEIKRLQRKSAQSVLLFIDLDDFKNINDKHGHQAGDAALLQFSQCVKSMLRASDKIGRYGGDEFIVLLSDTNEQEAQRFHERLLRKPIKCALTPDQSILLTFSVGIVVWHDALRTAQQWIDEADNQMYEEKRRHHQHNQNEQKQG
ncbi:diguanylate cyclase [Alteromonas sp. H39]|uniref:diguanylate cyclase n=1 Tax=Alteromonas sp. H39 TaxID=3389876 RepID=UPI0039E1484C